MESKNRAYLCIDLKSFYASVECVERGLDIMTTDLVVADPARSGNTICLAVSPSLRAKGVKGRARVFEIPKNLSYIMAPPRLSLYIDYAARIYKVYLDYIAPEDMHVYSIDEVFIDVTNYLEKYKMTPREMAKFLMNEVESRVGVRATAGVGTNMYLCKIALDILAKHSPDFIDELDEESYRERLWDHRPLTDFWRIGTKTAKRLERIGLTCMRDIANADEDVLYRIFGIDAELMIDHAYGRETATMADIKSYKNKSHSFSRGQVLMRDYTCDEGELIIKEMVEQLAHEMTELGKVTKNVSIAVGYSNALKLPMVNGSISLSLPTDANSIIMPAVAKLYRRIVDPSYPVRRMYINFNDIHDRDDDRQMKLFDLTDAEDADEGMTVGKRRKKELADPVMETQAKMKRDVALQEAVNSIRKKYGKDAMVRGMDLEEAATTIERHHLVGGHRK